MVHYVVLISEPNSNNIVCYLGDDPDSADEVEYGFSDAVLERILIHHAYSEEMSLHKPFVMVES